MSAASTFAEMPQQSTPDRTRVLLVDDSSSMLARAAAVLGSRFEVIGTANNGLEALEAATTLVPDVIVLDISMPGMTGFEVAANLAKRGSTAALVFLTVHDDPDFVAAARQAGGTGYVLKRRLASDLILAVQEALAGRSFVSAIA